MFTLWDGLQIDTWFVLACSFHLQLRWLMEQARRDKLIIPWKR